MTTFLFFQQIFLGTCCVLVIVLDAMYTAMGKKKLKFLPSFKEFMFLFRKTENNEVYMCVKW